MKDNIYLFGDNINLHQSKINSCSSISISHMKIFYLQSFNQFISYDNIIDIIYDQRLFIREIYDNLNDIEQD